MQRPMTVSGEIVEWDWGHLKQPGLLAKRDRTAFCFVRLLSGHLDVLAALVEVLFVKSVFVLVQEGPLHPLCPPAAMPNPCRMRRGSSPGAIYVYVFQFAVCYPSLSRSLSSASIWFPKLKSGDVTFGVRLRDVVPTLLLPRASHSLISCGAAPQQVPELCPSFSSLPDPRGGTQEAPSVHGPQLADLQLVPSAAGQLQPGPASQSVP